MNWKNMSLSHKIANVVSGAAVVVWMLSQIKTGILPVDLSVPAVAVFTVCEAVLYWESERKWSYLFIAGAAISMACFVWDLFL